jgi:hypothetical protein
MLSSRLRNLALVINLVFGSLGAHVLEQEWSSPKPIAILVNVAAALSAGRAAAQESQSNGGGRAPNPSDINDFGKGGYGVRESKNTPTEARPVENYNSLEVPAGLNFDSLLLDKMETPDFTKEVVRVEWRAGDPVDLWVVRPARVKTPPVILYLYSFPSTNDRYHDNEFCKFLTEKGFAAVGFASALTGDRFHDRPMKQWFISELQESLASSAHDVQLILSYLAKRGDVDMTRVGMFGDGSGASIAILSAAADPRIKALDLLNPWGDWPEWLANSPLVPEDERPKYIKPEFLKSVENLDPVKYLPSLKTEKIRLQFVDDRKVTPKVASQRIEAAAPSNAKIVHYPNMNQFFGLTALTGTGFDWLKEQLGGNVEAQVTGKDSKTTSEGKAN